MQSNHFQISNDLYDLIKGATIANKKADKLTDWDKLTQKHHEEATQSIKQFMHRKDISLTHLRGQEKSIIKIGRSITITIE